MARFILTPCHIREDRVVPSDEAVELDWPKLAALLAPSRSHQALMTLRRLKVDTYVGLVKQPDGGTTNFMFQSPDHTNDIAWLLKKDPTFPTKLDVIYRVELAQLDAKIEEFSSGEPN